MNPKLNYDIHLSAYSISKETIKKVEKLGFCRDEFTNNTRCETTEYHGTFRGDIVLPNDKIWEKICKVLSDDKKFSGGLEEEEFGKNDVVFFDNETHNQSLNILPKMTTILPPPNTYKGCDIHISIDMTNSNLSCLDYLEALSIPCFDKPKNGNIYRIFSITCETVDEGRRVFEFMKTYLGTIPGLKGKMKFEKTTKFFRLPENAIALPLINSLYLSKWFSNIDTLCYERQKNYS